MLDNKDYDIGNITPLLNKIELAVKDIKEKVIQLDSGPQSPVTKSMNVSLSMVSCF